MSNPVKQLETRWLGRSLHAYEEVTSTNTVLADLAAGGAPAGALVIANYQSQGRGRRQRRWLAPPHSSLLFSLLFRPQWPVARAHWLTMIAGLAVVAAVEARAPLQVGLKWPNDLMLWDEVGVQPQWSKAGGILLETQLDLHDDQLQQAIVGIGLNVNVPRQDLPATSTPATSLLAATGRTFSRSTLLAQILQRFEALYEDAAAGQSPHHAWNACLITRNRPVCVTTDHGTVEGLALGADESGRLLVRTPDGALHPFSAADVTLT